jgi:F-type H+-transporting ATPase subunit delta
MANGSLAKRYARALISLGKEDNTVDKLNNDLQAFGEVLSLNDNQLFKSLINPILKKEEISAVMNTVMEKLSLNPITRNFIKLLQEKGRLVLFFEIADVYQAMADEQAGRLRAYVETAKEISALERVELRKTLAEASKVTPENLMVEYNINPDLIGGIVAKVGDTLYDASIRSRLKDIKATLL